jgi:hypothetical protein
MTAPIYIYGQQPTLEELMRGAPEATGPLGANPATTPNLGVRSLLGGPSPISGGLLSESGWSGMLPPDIPSHLPTEPPPGSNLWERLLWRARRGLTGDAPPGYEAILGTQGVEQARPGIISALTGHGRLNDGFRQALDQAIKDRTQPMNIQQQLEQQAAVKALRNKYQLPDNATPEQVRENMAKYFYEASRMGLPIEGMGGAAAEAMRGINERDMPFSTVNAGDELYSFNKKTGTFTPGPQTGISADAMEMKRLELELKRQQIAATIAMKNNSNTEREQKRLDGLRNQFMNQNRDIVNSARGIEIAREAFDQLRSGNVAAFKSAIINFAGTVDPKAQLRQGVIQMIEKLDPSGKGQFEMGLERIMRGKLPDHVLKGMTAHVEGVRKSMMQLYDQRRKAAGKRVGGLADYIESADEMFGPALSQEGQGKVRKYLGNP